MEEDELMDGFMDVNKTGRFLIHSALLPLLSAMNVSDDCFKVHILFFVYVHLSNETAIGVTSLSVYSQLANQSLNDAIT